jgi:hypothetical protein
MVYVKFLVAKIRKNYELAKKNLFFLTIRAKSRNKIVSLPKKAKVWEKTFVGVGWQ